MFSFNLSSILIVCRVYNFAYFFYLFLNVYILVSKKRDLVKKNYKILDEDVQFPYPIRFPILQKNETLVIEQGQMHTYVYVTSFF